MDLNDRRCQIAAVTANVADWVFLVCAVLIGGLVPGFIAQYRQRLGGRLDQARLDLEPWQEFAWRFHDGDIERLIEHHLNSRDPQFHAEGGLIRALVATVQQLQRAAEALRGSLFHQAAYLALHADPRLLRATLSGWVPTFALSPEGLLFAALFALAVWLPFHVLGALLAVAVAACLVAVCVPALRSRLRSLAASPHRVTPKA